MFTWPRLQAHRKSIKVIVFVVFCVALEHSQTFCSRINGIAANKFERVCGHKGYSYDAFHDNVKAANIAARGGIPHPDGRSRVVATTMDEIGYEDCDWISNEIEHRWCKYVYKILFTSWFVPHH